MDMPYVRPGILPEPEEPLPNQNMPLETTPPLNSSAPNDNNKREDDEGEIHSELSNDGDFSKEKKKKLDQESDKRNEGVDEKERGRSRKSSGSRDDGKRHHHSRHHDKKRKRKKEKRKSHTHRRRRSSSRSRGSSSGSYSSRSRSRSRDRRRSRDRDRHRRRRTRRSHSRDSYERDYGDYGGNWQYDKTGPNDAYKYQEPNSTVMVRGMALHLTEFDIRQEIIKSGCTVRDIRLIRQRETGESRGFAFVEFNSVQDAVKWMEIQKGVITMQEQFTGNLIYSVPKSHSTALRGGSRVALADWFCSQCQGHNFKRREVCYKCGADKPEDADFEYSEETCSHPTNTIILSNLDTLTTEDGVLQAFEERPELASIPIRSVRVSREPLTNLSRGTCLIEANNVTDAMKVHAELLKEPLDIDGKRVLAAYARMPSQSSGNSSAAASAALAAAQWSNATLNPKSEEDEIERMAEYSAAMYAKTPEEHKRFLEYYRSYYKEHGIQGVGTTSKTDDTPTAKNQGGGEGHGSKRDEENSQGRSSDRGSKKSSSTTSGRLKAPASVQPTSSSQLTPSNGNPDKSRYQYDESSGYSYDPITELYYDPSTGYFYNHKKSQFLYWDPDNKQYVAVDHQASQEGSSSKEFNGSKNKFQAMSQGTQSGNDGDKVKVAKKIVKEMEKWARSLNQKKDFSKVSQVLTETGLSLPSYSAKTEEIPPPSMTYQPTTTYVATLPVQKEEPVSALVALTSSYELGEGEAPESDEEQKMKTLKEEYRANLEKSLVDLSKIACLLCKRQFPNMEVLQKHTQFSDLHKSNLEELLKKQQSSMNNPSSSSCTYRDRAKERRKKVGSEITTKNKLKDLYMKAKSESGKESPVVVEKPNNDERIPENNIGRKLLQKMGGWSEGMGLGKNNSGRTDIITTERRAPNLGLGMKTPSSLIAPVEGEDEGASRARKTLARYHELN